MDEVATYCNLMEEIKRRTEVIRAYLSGHLNCLFRAVTVETAALQLRKILELITLGSLVAHKSEYAKQYEKFASHWHAGRILRDVESINPKFYPEPIREVPSQLKGVKNDLVPMTSAFLTKEDFISVYSSLGDILHAKSPFAQSADYSQTEELIATTHSKIIALLVVHKSQLFQSPNFLLVHMHEERDNKCHAYIFAPTNKVEE